MLIDFHTHVFPPKLAAPALRTLSERSGIAPACDGTPEGTLSLMDSCGVDGAVLVEHACAYTQDDQPLEYSEELAVPIQVLTFEEAFELLGG